LIFALDCTGARQLIAAVAFFRDAGAHSLALMQGYRPCGRRIPPAPCRLS
jgi:methylphosphotriester-DNA--protein-cysteine methyltransferase